MTRLASGPRRRPRASAVLPPAAVLVLVLSLVGCTPEPATSSPTPSASVTASVPSELLPVYPADWTAETAAAETSRVATAIVALIDPDTVANDDDIEQEVPASEGGGAYFGVLHTLTMDPTTDTGAVARSVVAELASAGWAVRNSTESGGVTQVVLVSSPDSATSWLAAIGGDSSVTGEAVVSVQLASPDLP